MDVLRRVWKWISHAGTVAWLWTLGSSAVTGGVAAAVLRMLSVPVFLVALIGVGIGLITIAAALTFLPQWFSKATKGRQSVAPIGAVPERDRAKAELAQAHLEQVEREREAARSDLVRVREDLADFKRLNNTAGIEWGKLEGKRPLIEWAEALIARERDSPLTFLTVAQPYFTPHGLSEELNPYIEVFIGVSYTGVLTLEVAGHLGGRLSWKSHALEHAPDEQVFATVIRGPGGFSVGVTQHVNDATRRSILESIRDSSEFELTHTLRIPLKLSVLGEALFEGQLPCNEYIKCEANADMRKQIAGWLTSHA